MLPDSFQIRSPENQSRLLFFPIRSHGAKPPGGWDLGDGFSLHADIKGFACEKAKPHKALGIRCVRCYSAHHPPIYSAKLHLHLLSSCIHGFALTQLTTHEHRVLWPLRVPFLTGLLGPRTSLGFHPAMNSICFQPALKKRTS